MRMEENAYSYSISQSSDQLWRLNPLLLSDEGFTNFIVSEITVFLDIDQTPGRSSLTIRELLNLFLAISYGANLKKRKKKTNTTHFKGLRDKILR